MGTGYNRVMSKRCRTKKKKSGRRSSGERSRSRRDEYYTTGELVLAGVGVLVLILFAGIIITSLL